MTDIVVTRHGQVRLSQRGIREADLDLMLAHGTEIDRDRIILTTQDAARLIRNLKREVAKIERLTGKKFVVSDGRLVTAYHPATPVRPARGRQKARRRARRRSLDPCRAL